MYLFPACRASRGKASTAPPYTVAGYWLRGLFS
jgi:hypothetical protein